MNIIYGLLFVLLTWPVNAQTPVLNLQNGLAPKAAGDAKAFFDTSRAAQWWPNAVIHVGLSGVPNDGRRQLFIDLASQYEQASGLRFQFYTSSQAPNLSFSVIAQDNMNPLCSDLQEPSLGSPGIIYIRCWTRATVLYEIGHMAAFRDEQQRPNRGAHVVVNDIDNVTSCNNSAYLRRFNVINGNAFISEGAYDYASVMHLSKLTLINCSNVAYRVTMEAVGPQPAGDPPGSSAACNSAVSCTNLLGTATELSPRDKLALAKFWGLKLSTSTSGDGTGTVTVSPNLGNCGTDCFRVTYNANVTITAVPAPDSIALISGACQGRGTCTAAPTTNGTANVRFIKKRTLTAILVQATQTPVGETIFRTGFEN